MGECWKEVLRQLQETDLTAHRSQLRLCSHQSCAISYHPQSHRYYFLVINNLNDPNRAHRLTVHQQVTMKPQWMRTALNMLLSHCAPKHKLYTCFSGFKKKPQDPVLCVVRDAVMLLALSPCGCRSALGLRFSKVVSWKMAIVSCAMNAHINNGP